MNETIAVIAASGRSGRACVEALLAAGYRVRAGIHRQAINIEHPNLTQLRCDAMRAEDIAALLDGADAVVSMIGHTRRSPADVQVQATRHCINYIEANRPSMRYIGLTGTGVRQPGDRIGLADWGGNTIIRWIDPARIRDGIEHAVLLQKSSVNYTILRVLKLTNGRRAGAVHLTARGPVELLTPRTRVAAAVVELLQTGAYVREMPIISRARH